MSTTAPAGWQTTVTTVGRHWGLTVVSGALSLLLGIAALAWPHASLLLVAIVFAISLLGNGIILIIMAVADQDSMGGRRVLLGILGALAVLVGVLCLRAPQRTLAVVTLLIGSWWIISGVLLIIAAMTDPVQGGRGWAALRGVVSLVAGLIVLLQPRISLLALVITLGVALIALGLLLIVEGIRIRSRAQVRKE